MGNDNIEGPPAFDVRYPGGPPVPVDAPGPAQAGASSTAPCPARNNANFR
ncbi:hypothetical protein GCM10027590_11630 [Nocardiopsis nanhaiensis]